MENFIVVDKEFWKYFLLCLKDSGKKWLEHFEGWKKVTEPIGVAIATVALTLFAQRIVNGVVKTSDWNIAIISVIGAPIVWLAFVYVVKLLFAPFRLYKQQEAELKKYDLDGIDFSITPYSIVGSKGWAIRVENKKNFDLNRVIMEIKDVLVGEKYVIYEHKEPAAYILKFIDEVDGMLNKRIDDDFWGAKSWIPRGKSREFIITRNPVNLCEFESTPDNLNLLEKGLDAEYIETNLPILKIEFRCGVANGNESWTLPFKTIFIQSKKDGSFDFAESES